ncbi:sensor histidine kinase [Vibrio sp. RC27]
MSNSRLILSDLFDHLSFAICIVRADYIIEKANTYFQAHAVHTFDSTEEQNILELFPAASNYLKPLIDSVFKNQSSHFASWEKLSDTLPFKRDRTVYGEADKMQQDWEFVPIYENGNVTHVGLCIYDSTVQASQEKQLHLILEQLNAERKQRQKLEQKLSEVQGQLIYSEKMASIGQISTGIAHEINHPIESMTANMHTFKDHTQNIESAVSDIEKLILTNADQSLIEQFKTLKVANRLDAIFNDTDTLINESLLGSDRVLAIIENLKEFSQEDASEWSYASLVACIESTLKIINNDIKYGVSIERDYENEVPDIYCQPMQINQVLLNLIVNASQAIDSEGIIKISLSKIDASSVEIRVKDNGTGIKTELQQRVFEPSFTTKGGDSGTGLGLSVSHDIIERHHGKIRLQSKVGVGTEFIVTLPIIKQPTDDVGE